MPELTLNRKDFITNQEIRWCPGCGDYAILNAIYKTLPNINKNKEDIVFISGIGCSSRLPYYLNTYGFHTIHGRALTISTGVKLSNPKLSVWTVTGDGDALAIGGNHFIHAIRRNIDINVLLFNNEIYGLTKGQFSPTSRKGTITKSSPEGTLDTPFNIGKLCLGSGNTFFSRVVDTQPKKMTEIFIASEKHKGTSIVEILQNCVIFNDKIFDQITNKSINQNNHIWLEHGKPMIYGEKGNKGIILENMQLKSVNLDEEDYTINDILIHDSHQQNDTLHNLLIGMHPNENSMPLALGIIRSIEKKSFDQVIWDNIKKTKEKDKNKNLNDILNSGITWDI